MQKDDVIGADICDGSMPDVVGKPPGKPLAMGRRDGLEYRSRNLADKGGSLARA